MELTKAEMHEAIDNARTAMLMNECSPPFYYLIQLGDSYAFVELEELMQYE